MAILLARQLGSSPESGDKNVTVGLVVGFSFAGLVLIVCLLWLWAYINPAKFPWKCAYSTTLESTDQPLNTADERNRVDAEGTAKVNEESTDVKATPGQARAVRFAHLPVQDGDEELTALPVSPACPPKTQHAHGRSRSGHQVLYAANRTEPLPLSPIPARGSFLHSAFQFLKRPRETSERPTATRATNRPNDSKAIPHISAPLTSPRLRARLQQKYCPPTLRNTVVGDDTIAPRVKLSPLLIRSPETVRSWLGEDSPSTLTASPAEATTGRRWLMVAPTPNVSPELGEFGARTSVSMPKQERLPRLDTREGARSSYYGTEDGSMDGYNGILRVNLGSPREWVGGDDGADGGILDAMSTAKSKGKEKAVSAGDRTSELSVFKRHPGERTSIV